MKCIQVQQELAKRNKYLHSYVLSKIKIIYQEIFKYEKKTAIICILFFRLSSRKSQLEVDVGQKKKTVEKIFYHPEYFVDYLSNLAVLEVRNFLSIICTYLLIYYRQVQGHKSHQCIDRQGQNRSNRSHLLGSTKQFYNNNGLLGILIPVTCVIFNLLCQSKRTRAIDDQSTILPLIRAKQSFSYTNNQRYIIRKIIQYESIFDCMY